MPTWKRRKEKMYEGLVRVLASLSVLFIAFIIIFIFYKAWPVIQVSGLGLLTGSNFDTQVQEAFYASEDAPVLDFGLLGLIMGTIVTTGLALIVAALLGIGASVFMSEYAPALVATILKAVVRLLASIPSVVFGLLALVTVVPYIQDYLVSDELALRYQSDFQITGLCLLASVIVLIFMIVPTVISLSIDALDAVPGSHKEIGYAVGMSHFRVIWRIVLPGARSGIIAGITLAAGRGIGEAIAVSMVCGGLGIIPDLTKGLAGLLAPVLPLASAIVNKSEAMSSESVMSALFACASLLLVIGVALSLGARLIESRMRKAEGYAA